MAYVNLNSEALSLDVGASHSSRNSAQSWGRKLIKNIQYGRMIGVMKSFSDEALEEIGISRSEIPAYARRLIDAPE